VKSAKKGAIYNPPRNLPIGSRKGQKCTPVDRPVNWLIVIFMTVEPPFDLLVDRDWIHRAAALYRSTSQSIGAISRVQSSLDGRPLGRSAHQPKLPCTFVHVDWLDRSTDFCSGRPVRSTGRRL